MKLITQTIPRLLALAGISATAVLSQPIITKQPIDFSVSLGAGITNTVSSTGILPLRYQWYFNSIALAEATNRTLVRTNIQLVDAGDYSVVVSDATGSVTSKIAKLGVDPTFTTVTTGAIVSGTGIFIACAWGDYDNDGYEDLFTGGEGRGVLVHNNSDGTFTKITNGVVANIVGSTWATAWGDYDNDGQLDLFVGNHDNQKNLLFHNDGEQGFSKVTSGPFVSDFSNATGCSWGDYDQDGWVDLFVANRDVKSFLYHNDAGGSFHKITNSSAANTISHNNSASWADYNNDGLIDLFVAAPNALYRNEADGTLTRVTNSRIASFNGGGVGWADYDNDGFLDLAVSEWNDSSVGIHLYRNNGDGTFTTTVLSLERQALFGCAWGDYDNDGFVDLYVGSVSGKNLLFHNDGNGKFTKVLTGSPVNDSHSGSTGPFAWADYDNDGFLDLFVGTTGGGSNHLYRNNRNNNNWLKLKLIGAVSNRAALGATAHVKATIDGKGVWQLREISAGDGFSGNTQIAHFGLGEATVAETIRINWPSGIVQELHNVTANQALTVTEPPMLEPGVMRTRGPIELKIKSWKGFVYEIQASSNLKSWTRLTTITNETGTFSFADPAAVSANQRFYRAVAPKPAGLAN